MDDPDAPEKCALEYVERMDRAYRSHLMHMPRRVIHVQIIGPDVTSGTSLFEVLKKRHSYVKMELGQGKAYYRFDFFRELHPGQFFKVSFKVEASKSL